VVITDTIPAGERCAPIKDKLTVLSVGELLGEAIGRIHNNTSISALFRGTAGVKR
jgi:phosphoribosylpyrophosphate synthetase